MQAHQSIDWQNKMLGRYRLLNKLGQGGMGEVWLGEDTQLRRRIAVKLLPVTQTTDAAYLQDFEREARAAAALEHPNILPVHDFGKQQISKNGLVTYLILPYINGGSLRDRVRSVKGLLPPNEILQYLRQAAQAIDFAHSRNVLHRDIKPANMLLQQNWLFLADFGIAKLLTGMTQQNRTHAGAGTPEYMAPEQVQGKAEFASDRYSFAIVAYQLCTGQLPFRGDTPYATLMKQITEVPPTPRNFNAGLPPGVEQAILWGLRKQPQERPPSCMALVEAMEQGLRGNTVSGSPYPTAQSNAYPMPATPPSVSHHVSQGQQLPLHHNGQSPQSSMVPASPISSTQNADQMLHSSTPNPAYQANGPMFPSATQSAPGMTQAATSGNKLPRRAVLIGGGVAALALVGGASTLAYLHFAHANTTGTPQSSATVTPTPVPGPRKLVKGTPILSLTGHNAAVNVVAWDPSGRYLASGGVDEHVKVWDVASVLANATGNFQTLSTPLRDWKIPTTSSGASYASNPNTLCWSNDGRTIGVVTGDGNVQLLNMMGNATTPDTYQDNSQNNSLNLPSYNVIAWSPKANMFATNTDFLIHTQLQTNIWQPGKKTGPAHTFIYKDANTLNTLSSLDVVSFSPDGSLLAGYTNFGPIVLWDTATGAIKRTLQLPSRPTPKDMNGIINNECMEWSSANSHLLATSDIDIANIWDAYQNKLLLNLQLNEPVFIKDHDSYFVWGLSWAPNGKYMAMCYPRSPKIYIWDVQTAGITPGTTRQELFSFPDTPVNTAAITDVAWSPNGRYIAASSADHTIIVWKVDAA